MDFAQNIVTVFRLTEQGAIASGNSINRMTFPNEMTCEFFAIGAEY
jgi:hypothetical protein